MKKIVLSGMTAEEICAALNLDQKFRAMQIFEWIAKGATDFNQMTNLSKAQRDEFSSKAQLCSSNVSKILKDPDGTIKLQ